MKIFNVLIETCQAKSTTTRLLKGGLVSSVVGKTYGRLISHGKKVLHTVMKYNNVRCIIPVYVR